MIIEIMEVEDAYKILADKIPLTKEDLKLVYNLLHNVYYQGRSDGMQQVKDQLHDVVDKLLEDT